MTLPRIVRVGEDQEHGVLARCSDAQIADEIEDFLAEQGDVPFSVKFDDAEVVFYFGHAICRDRVVALLEKFFSEQ